MQNPSSSTPRQQATGLLLQDALQYAEKPVPDERRKCSGEELFDWLADTLLDFAAEQGWCDSGHSSKKLKPAKLTLVTCQQVACTR